MLLNKKNFVCFISFLIVFALSSISYRANAATYTASIATSGSINLDVSAAGIGASVATDNVKVISTCPSGYNLSVAATSSTNQNFSDTSLYKSGDSTSSSKISPTAGTLANPATIIGDNRGTWGFNMTSPDATSTFTGLNTTQTLLTTKSTGTTIDGETIPVYYGASVTPDTEPGTYKMSDDAVITYYLTTSLDCTSYQVAFNPTSIVDDGQGGTTELSGTGTMNNQRIAEGTPTNLDSNAFTAPTGYAFEEWNTAQDGTGTAYTDGQQVTDLTTIGNTITLYAQWSKEATLDTGQTVNQKIKRLAGNSSADYKTTDSNVTALVRANTLPTSFTPTADNTISTSSSTQPIYAWYDSASTTIYYYSAATDIKMNQDSSYFFNNMYALSDLSTISSWNTSSVTNMSNMFSSTGNRATTFTLDLSSWNTASVTDMNSMFFFTGRNATTWSIGGLSSWNTASVTDMNSMFFYAGGGATTFTLDLSSWDTSSVTNMYLMFTAIGYSATTWSIGDLSSWNTSSVTSMSRMFDGAGRSATTWSIGDLSSWNTSSVTNMSSMFSDAGRSATTWSVGNLSSWDTSSVTSMYSMFDSAGRSATTWSIGDLSSWNTASVTDMSSMFNQAGYSATTFTLDLSSWNTSNVTNMLQMFSRAGYNATTFTLNLSSWNTASVTNMSGMFSSAGNSATTWSVTIPKNNGATTSPITNTTSRLYGKTTSAYGTPPSGKSFTLAN